MDTQINILIACCTYTINQSTG